MNVLLADPQYWSAAARTSASGRFDDRVIAIFYDALIPEARDAFAVRDEFLPLPSLAEGYRRVLLLGTTGAGKTTLVRQLIGTDPDEERFPSTSTAKTTIADTEIVTGGDSVYRAIVTFAARDEVREYLEDCVLAAVLAAYRGADDAELRRRLLEHVDQRFRFSYVLGPSTIAPDEDDDEEDDDEVRGEPVLVGPEELGDLDLEETERVLADALESVKEIAAERGDQLRNYLSALDEEDERVVDELFEEHLDELLRDDEQFHALADGLMEQIEHRFDALDVGQLLRDRQGWPLSWRFEIEDRRRFLRAVTRFSSNYAPYFGRLLTPLVNGLRVSGPFAPAWAEEGPRLVIYDGEGLGHTPDSTSSISTSVSSRFHDVDAVLLVDNATQPMQAAPVAAMGTVAMTGHASKLLVCFTHFDQVQGDNLPTATAKQRHVLASAENVLTRIGEDLGLAAERSLRKRLEVGRFFVSGIHAPLDSDSKAGRRTLRELNALFAAIEAIVELPELPAARPVYDRWNLVLAVRAATQEFHDRWQARLGLHPKPGIGKEHWARVKALSRRLALRMDNEYRELRPIADLHRGLQANIYIAIQEPVEWDGGSEPTDEERQEVFAQFATAISRRLLDLAETKLSIERVEEWRNAFAKRGQGSTFERAEIIADDVYTRAAPIPDVTPSPDRNRFLHDVLAAVTAAADEVGVKLQ